ncbi:cyclic nucleotide-binding domain-containing protein, partial [Deinococcus sp.]|uniref:Crp/Fnr family transcriptional regulator n=1 Tax=Deinococcus sp. TaxID=47478 RepID=UPI002869BEB9
MSALNANLDALRTVPALQNLDPDGLIWLAENASWLEFAPNDVIFEEGQPASFMLIIVEGGVQVIGAAAGNTVLRAVSAPALGGKLPFSRLEVFPGTARAVGHTRLARVEEEVFPEVIARLPGLQPHIVATLSDRVRESKQAEDEQEKLSALGRLSAGLAHELNNPAAAATRAAAQLRERLGEERALARRLAALPPDAREGLDAVRLATRVDGAGTRELDPLARADLEDDLAAWLDGHGVGDAWSLAPDLIRAGLDAALLEPVASALDPTALGAAVAWLAAAASVDEAISQVEGAATRVSELVGAVKTYTHMDRARVSEIDVHDGLESTLTLLGHKLRSITVER